MFQTVWKVNQNCLVFKSFIAVLHKGLYYSHCMAFWNILWRSACIFSWAFSCWDCYLSFFPLYWQCLKLGISNFVTELCRDFHVTYSIYCNPKIIFSFRKLWFNRIFMQYSHQPLICMELFKRIYGYMYVTLTMSFECSSVVLYVFQGG